MIPYEGGTPFDVAAAVAMLAVARPTPSLFYRLNDGPSVSRSIQYSILGVGLYTHTLILLKLPAGCWCMAGRNASDPAGNAKAVVDGSTALVVSHNARVHSPDFPPALLDTTSTLHAFHTHPSFIADQSTFEIMRTSRFLPLDNLTRSHQPLSASSPENLCVFLRFATPLPRPFFNFCHLLYPLSFRRSTFQPQRIVLSYLSKISERYEVCCSW
jgi:hypothetical protein